jgi:hypothetical protein
MPMPLSLALARCNHNPAAFAALQPRAGDQIVPYPPTNPTTQPHSYAQMQDGGLLSQVRHPFARRSSGWGLADTLEVTQRSHTRPQRAAAAFRGCIGVWSTRSWLRDRSHVPPTAPFSWADLYWRCIAGWTNQFDHIICGRRLAHLHDGALPSRQDSVPGPWLCAGLRSGIPESSFDPHRHLRLSVVRAASLAVARAWMFATGQLFLGGRCRLVLSSGALVSDPKVNGFELLDSPQADTRSLRSRIQAPFVYS